VDGDGDRDLFRAGARFDEIVRSDGAALIGPAERVEIKSPARSVVAPASDDEPLRAFAIAHETLHEAQLEWGRAARLGQRWRVARGLPDLRSADLRGPGQAPPIMIGPQGVAVLVDPAENERLQGWSSGDAFVGAAAVVDLDHDGRPELLLALR